MPTGKAQPGNITPIPSPTTETPLNDIDRSNFPMLVDAKDMLGNKYEDTSWDLLFIELTKMLKDGSVVTATDRRPHEQSWVHVPIDSTDALHARQVNSATDGDKFDSARRACNYLAIKHPDSMMASLK